MTTAYALIRLNDRECKFTRKLPNIVSQVAELVTSTLVTLIVIPVVYEWRHGRRFAQC
jgi:hypothetical protein